MSGLTTDPRDPDLGHGVNDEPVPQNSKYLVLGEDTGPKDFVRPLRTKYMHATELGGCGAATTMGYSIAATYARQPDFYGATYCVGCRKHRPVGADGEFFWDGTTEKVGT